MKACSICSITTQVSVATSLDKSQAVHSLAFNTTDSLFNSPVCETVNCFFLISAGVASKRLLWLNKQRKQTMKLKLKWGPKNTPAIIDYHHRCRKIKYVLFRCGDNGAHFQTISPGRHSVLHSLVNAVDNIKTRCTLMYCMGHIIIAVIIYTYMTWELDSCCVVFTQVVSPPIQERNLPDNQSTWSVLEVSRGWQSLCWVFFCLLIMVLS